MTTIVTKVYDAFHSVNVAEVKARAAAAALAEHDKRLDEIKPLLTEMSGEIKVMGARIDGVDRRQWWIIGLWTLIAVRVFWPDLANLAG